MKNSNNFKEAKERIKNKEIVVFGMSGKMASGKDTVGNLVSERLQQEGYWIIETSFGKVIRDEIEQVLKMHKNGDDLEPLAAEIKDINHLVKLLENTNIYERSEQSREALQFWGTEVRRSQNSNYWIQSMENFIIESVLKGQSVNITDARFPNEIDLILKFGGKVARLEVSEEIRRKRIMERDSINVAPEALRHPSETALDNYPFDVVYDATLEPIKICNRISYCILEC